MATARMNPPSDLLQDPAAIGPSGPAMVPCGQEACGPEPDVRDEPEVDAAGALGRLLGQTLPLAGWSSRRGVRYTPRWKHPPRRGCLPALGEHVVAVTYSGIATVILERDGVRRTGQLRHGTVTLLPAGTEGQVDFSGGHECSHVLIPPSALEPGDLVQVDGTPRLQLALADPVLFRLVEMLAAMPPDDGRDPGFREQCAALICTHLLNRHCSPVQLPTAVAPGLANWQLRRIEEFMRGRLHAPLSLQDMAAQVGLSRHYLCTAFRRSTGLAPYEYLTLLRMGRAKELLAASERSIGEIAVAVGYGTPSAFAASFRRSTGLTPRAYRDRARDGGSSPPGHLPPHEAGHVPCQMP